jgi:predicted transcriptional regulator of viral defense system
MQLEDFFARHTVFTRAEYVAFMNFHGATNSNSQRELLAYHVKKGHVIKVRRGFYATVSKAVSDPSSMPVDGYLIAGRVAKDAVLSYHTALDFHGVAYSIYYTFYFCSHHAMKVFSYQGNTFNRIPFPKTLIDNKQEMLATEKKERQGQDVYVSTLERTLVDVLDRPELAGGWEEIWRSLEMVAVLDLDLVVQYALALENATTVAKVGFFLETHQEEFSVMEKHLTKLERHIPSGKHYIDRKTTRDSKLIKRWNLMVPVAVLEKNWEEHNDFI